MVPPPAASPEATPQQEAEGAASRQAAGGGMVLWVTGLSGSGKTTLCRALWDLLKPRLPELVVLDGDVIRAAFGNDLGYREADRIIQIKRLQGLARALAEQGQVVVVAAVYAHPELLAWNRRSLPSYFEIYLEASLETLRRRDTKDLYARAEAGRITDVVGVDIPWQAPTSPDLTMNTDEPVAPEVLAQRVVAAVPCLTQLLEPV